MENNRRIRYQHSSEHLFFLQAVFRIGKIENVYTGIVYKMDFLRFLNDDAEKTSQTEKAIFPGAEKNDWEWLFTLPSKKKSIYVTLNS